MQKVGINTQGNGVESTKNIKKIQLQNEITPVDIVEKQYVNEKSTSLADSLGLLIKGVGVAGNIKNEMNRQDAIDERQLELDKKNKEKIDKETASIINKKVNANLENEYQQNKLNELKTNKGYADLTETEKRQLFLQKKKDSLVNIKDKNEELQKKLIDNFDNQKQFINKGVTADIETLKNENYKINSQGISDSLKVSKTNEEFKSNYDLDKRKALRNGTDKFDFNKTVLDNLITSGNKEQLDYALNDLEIGNGIKFSSLEGFKSKLQNRREKIDEVNFEKNKMKKLSFENILNDTIIFDEILEKNNTEQAVDKFVVKQLENINKYNKENGLPLFNKEDFTKKLYYNVIEYKQKIFIDKKSNEIYKKMTDDNLTMEESLNTLNGKMSDKNISKLKKSLEVKIVKTSNEDFQNYLDNGNVSSGSKETKVYLNSIQNNYEKNKKKYTDKMKTEVSSILNFDIEKITDEEIEDSKKLLNVFNDGVKNGNKDFFTGDTKTQRKMNIMNAIINRFDKTSSMTDRKRFEIALKVANVDIKVLSDIKKNENYKNGVSNLNDTFFLGILGNDVDFSNESFRPEDITPANEFYWAYTAAFNREPTAAMVKSILPDTVVVDTTSWYKTNFNGVFDNEYKATPIVREGSGMSKKDIYNSYDYLADKYNVDRSQIILSNTKGNQESFDFEILDESGLPMISNMINGKTVTIPNRFNTIELRKSSEVYYNKHNRTREELENSLRDRKSFIY